MDALLDAYRDPMFVWFPLVTTAVSMGSFALFAGPLTWLAWRAPRWAERFRIQSRRPRPQELVGPSIARWLVNNVVLTAIVVASWPLVRQAGVHAGELPAWWRVAGEVLLFIHLDDFLFYWVHRALHTPWLFRRVHGVHHRILTPWAVTAHYMHPLEYVATGLLALLGPLLVGAHVVTVWIWVTFRQLEAAEGHSGYDLPFTPTHWLPSTHGAFHHDLHHARVHGNFAGYFPHCDRWFGTLVRGYAEARARWRAGQRVDV